jgi:hypothetical protein
MEGIEEVHHVRPNRQLGRLEEAGAKPIGAWSTRAVKPSHRRLNLGLDEGGHQLWAIDPARVGVEPIKFEGPSGILRTPKELGVEGMQHLCLSAMSDDEGVADFQSPNLVPAVARDAMEWKKRV